MESFNTFGFNVGDDDIRGAFFEKYKAKKGEVHRCSIIFSDPKAMFVRTLIHFYNRIFICKKSICCDKLGAPKWRIGAVIIKYGTDKNGNVKTPFSYELYPWFFSESIYAKLKQVNLEYPLASHDVKISCTNDQYQHLDIIPCNEVIWSSKDTLKKQILEEAKPIWDSLKKSLASDLSVDEIKELLDMAPSTTTDNVQRMDLEHILNSL